MLRRSNVYFENNPPIDDQVVFAVAPIDAFSGRIITRELDVRIASLPNRPIRNLSGLYVFMNLPAPPPYHVTIGGEAAGYFDEEADFILNAAEPDVAKRLRLDVPLQQRPGAPLDPDATTVVGVVVKGDDAAVAAVVKAHMPAPSMPGSPTPSPFATRTDKRGAFNLPLRLPADVVMPVAVRFTFEAGTAQREIVRDVREGGLRAFKEPIDLDGTNVPELDTVSA